MTHPITLLVVDDDPEIRAYVRRTVEFLCPFISEVREAESGRRALEIVKEGGVTGLLTDVQLPGLDGLGLCRAVEEQVEGTIPVLLISGETSRTGDAQTFAAAAPHRAFLSKPFNAFQLSTALKSLFDPTGKPQT